MMTRKITAQAVGLRLRKAARASIPRAARSGHKRGVDRKEEEGTAAVCEKNQTLRLPL
jgi:hypothetical protein